MLRTRPASAAADAVGQDPGLTDTDMETLAAVAHRQPVTRAALGEMFGRTVGRDRIRRLREPRAGERVARAGGYPVACIR